jgi:ClpP class serine protease
MICFGASKIIMGATSELGPIDPQLTIPESGVIKRFSVYNVVESYRDLFSRAVNEKGNLQPYLQQLANYDEREIKELKAALSLSEDIAIRTLASGMMKGM